MLGRAGRFERLGSSVSGLMVWRDLDLGASCGRPESRAGLGDDVAAGRPPAHHPAGLPQRDRGAQLHLSCRGTDATTSWRATRPDAGDEWKIDVSLWSPEAPPGPLAHAEELRRRLTPETRLAILWIKDVWHRVSSYPDQVSGMDVYDAVLEHGVRTPEQFGGISAGAVCRAVGGC